MSDTHDDKVTSTKAQDTVPSSSKIVKKKRSGKGSKQRRQDSYRAEKAKDVNAAIKKRFFDRTFGDADLDVSFLEKHRVVLQEKTAQIACTNRGVGFISDAMYERLKIEYPRKIEPLCTIFQLFRASLAQQAVKMFIAERMRAITGDDVIQTTTFVSHEIVELVQSYDKCLRPLQTVIDGFGVFTESSCQFWPVVPDMRIIERPEPAEGDVASSLAMDVDVDVYLDVEPHLVTYHNLDKVVNALSVRGVLPRQTRRRFAELNPLPGAVYDNRYILVNPDEICPNYWPSYDSISNDLRHYSALLDFMEMKRRTVIARLDLKTGKGVGYGLVSKRHAEVGGLIQTAGQRLDSIGDDLWFSSYPISDRLSVGGMISLLGEYPYKDHPPERTYRLSTRSWYQSWRGLMDALLASMFGGR